MEEVTTIFVQTFDSNLRLLGWYRHIQLLSLVYLDYYLEAPVAFTFFFFPQLSEFKRERNMQLVSANLIQS